MSGNLEWNKIFGAGLATALVIIAVPQIAGAIYHQEAPEKMGYFVDAPEEVAGGAEEAELPPDWGTVRRPTWPPVKPPSRVARPAIRSTRVGRTGSVRTCTASLAGLSCTVRDLPIPTL
jgi:hypothetical protein